VSAVILTKNEERHIERCMCSVAFADEIVVVDSGSTDATVEIARRCGARVVEQEWLGYSAQRNAGAAAATHDWVLWVDADEVVSGPLARSVEAALRAPMDPLDGYVVERRNDFLGVLLPNEARARKRRGFVRMYHRRHSHYEPRQLVHEEVRVPGRLRPLDGLLLHWRGQTFLSIARVFVGYAELESEALEREGRRASWLSILGRPFARFVWVYLLKGYWRVGTRGLMYAMLKANSELLREGRLWERQNLDGPVLDPPLNLC
jgi:glycosyltransferase involved in cell wall biosynthesis